MPTILMYKTSGGFIPADDVQAEVYEHAKIHHGDLVKVTFTSGRKYRFLQKFHVMIRKTFDMQERWTSLIQWRTIVTAGAGWCDYITNKDGEMVAVPRSISYDSMPDEDEFQQVYEDILSYICEEYVDDTPGRIETILEFI